MSPAARISLPSGRSPSISISSVAPARFRVQGWDPVLIISQIVSLQALHYLTLALVLPILLSILAKSDLLAYEGGASSIGMAMNWRAFTGATVSGVPASRILQPGLVGLSAAASGGYGGVGVKVDEYELSRGVVRVIESDAMRGWAVAVGWVAASMADIFFLYHIVRRPTHILDFSLTLIFNHLILTTYYSSAFPSSFFFWFVLAASTVAQIVLAEQWCVRREMRDGFSVGGEMTPHLGGDARLHDTRDDLEMGHVHKNGDGRGYERVPQADERV
ncbi:hypothetical protein JCM10207_007524 [Rhodosporidiobolus poonsookiae]